MTDEVIKTHNKLSKALFMAAASVITLVALLTSSFPPWGIFWEGRGLLVAFAGCLAGVLASISIPGHANSNKLRELIPDMLALGGVSILWALIVAGFNSNQNPAENPFDVPVWAELYQIILFVSCGIAWFWWHRSRDVLIPALLLVILSATADGMLFNHYMLSTTYLFLAMTALWVGIVWIRQGLPSFRNPLMSGGLGLILITLVASIQGVSFGESINFVWRLVSGWFLALGIIALMNDERRKTPLLVALSSAGILITLLTLIRYIYLTPIIGFGNSLTFRLSMAKTDSNALGAAMILPLALFIFIRKSFPPKLKILFWILVILMLIPVFLSLSKSLWIGIGLMVALGLILSGRNWKRYLLLLIIVILIISALAVLFPVISDRMFSEYSVSFRQLIYQTVFRSILAHPVLGWGPYNTFIHATFAINLPYESVFLDRYYLTSHTHSLWLELTEGTGFIGLLCFLAIVILVFRNSSKGQNWIIAALTGLLLTLTFMGGLSSFNLIPYDLWILLALLSRHSRRSLPWFGGIIVFALIIGGLGMSAESFKRMAASEIAQGWLDSARDDISIARNLNPFSMEYPALEANIHLLNDDFPAAIKCYDRCVELAPLHPIWRSRRGVARLVNGDTDSAITDLTVATESDYWGVTGMGDLHAPLAAALATAGISNLAATNLGIVAGLFPGFPTSPWASLVATPDGFSSCLCPDFSPAGSVFERYLRCKYWLFNSVYPSQSTFRTLYPYSDAIILYTPIIYDQLQREDIARNLDYKSGLKEYFTLGDSFYEARRAEGKIGTDLSAMFGSFSQIPIHFLRLLNTDSTISSFYHVYSNLGLALYASASGQKELVQPLIAKSTEKGLLSNPHEFEFYNEAGTRIANIFPSETAENLPRKLALKLRDRSYEAARSIFRTLMYLYITSDTGYEKAEELASMLFQSQEISPGIMIDIKAAFGPQAITVIIEAYLLRLAGDNEKAEEKFTLAWSLAPHNRLVMQNSINGLINIGKIDKAVDYINDYLAEEPYDMDGLCNLARNMAQAGKPDVSKEILDHLLATFPHSSQPYLLQASLAEQEKNAQLQFQALSTAITLAPTDMDTIISLSNFDLSHGDSTNARLLIERGLEINPAHLSLWMSYVALAETDHRQTQALEYARFAHAIDETNTWVTTTLVAQLLNQGNLDEALSLINTLLATQPGDADALYWRAKLYDRQGNKEAAMADYEKLISMKNAAMNIYVEVASLRMEQNRPQEALRLMQQATDLYPNDSWGWATLGDIARRTKNFDLARMALDKALALAPDNESYRTLRQNVEKLPLADLITDCEKTLAAGDKPSALAKAETAVHQYPAESWAWANLAYMAHEAGNKQRAIVAINKAIALAPNNKTWQKLRSEILK